MTSSIIFNGTQFTLSGHMEVPLNQYIFYKLPNQNKIYCKPVALGLICGKDQIGTEMIAEHDMEDYVFLLIENENNVHPVKLGELLAVHMQKNETNKNRLLSNERITANFLIYVLFQSIVDKSLEEIYQLYESVIGDILSNNENSPIKKCLINVCAIKAAPITDKEYDEVANLFASLLFLNDELDDPSDIHWSDYLNKNVDETLILQKIPNALLKLFKYKNDQRNKRAL